MEFYIKDIEDPGFDPTKMHSESEIAQLLTQIEVLLFTSRGDVLGDPGFGLNLDHYVYSLRYNDYMLKSIIERQLETYVPLSRKFNVKVSVEFTDEIDRHLLFVDILIDSKYQVGVFI